MLGSERCLPAAAACNVNANLPGGGRCDGLACKPPGVCG
jgi:hypothetical protein